MDASSYRRVFGRPARLSNPLVACFAWWRGPLCPRKYLYLFGLAAVWIVHSLSMAPAQGSRNDSRVDTDQVRRLFFHIEIDNPRGVPMIPDYVCANFRQRVRRRSVTSVHVDVAIDAELPSLQQAFPITCVPNALKKYLAATPHIEKDAPEVAAAARSILSATHPVTLRGLLDGMRRWLHNTMTYAYPAEVPSAVRCLRRGSGNCIGYTHVAAAILRHLGVPVRTVRTYIGYDWNGRTGIQHHSIIELYSPADRCWLILDPQGMAPPIQGSIYLYSDPDWSVAGQHAIRPLTLSPDTTVTISESTAPQSERTP